MRSPENIVEEVRHCMRAYGMRDFLLWSDVFNFDDLWVRRLCEAILASGLRFAWASNMRADKINRETLGLMKRAGCSLISLGIESGSQEILDRAGKRITIGQIEGAVRLIREAGLASFAYFMAGLPWETRETAAETMRLSRDLGADFANFFVAAPFPGTAYFEYAVGHGLFEDRDPADAGIFAGAYGAAVVKSHYLSRPEIDGLYRQTVRSFYLRPGYVLRRLSRVGSFRELAAYARAGRAVRRPR
jgi:radical SAM superfamily enzyme YgiQ (UPF0313 family)